MKTRIGFVSNSSSSSFLIVGTNDEKIVADLWEKLGPGKKRGCTHDETKNPFCAECGAPMWVEDEAEEGLSYGAFPAGSLTFYGNEAPPYCVGIDARPRLKSGDTFKELCDTFISLCNQVNVKVRPKDVDIHYGRAGNG